MLNGHVNYKINCLEWLYLYKNMFNCYHTQIQRCQENLVELFSSNPKRTKLL